MDGEDRAPLREHARPLVLAELVLRALGIGPARFAHPWHLETEDKRVGLDVYPDDPRDYFPIDLRDEAERERWHARGLTEVDWRWERTPDAIGFEYSAELCRGGPIGPAGERARVVAIGDSVTEGQGVLEEDTFAARLGRAIEGAQVINCGRRGHDFPEIRTFFDRQLALEPDVVVYAMILNDPTLSEAPKRVIAEQRCNAEWALTQQMVLRSGYLLT